MVIRRMERDMLMLFVEGVVAGPVSIVLDSIPADAKRRIANNLRFDHVALAVPGGDIHLRDPAVNARVAEVRDCSHLRLRPVGAGGRGGDRGRLPEHRRVDGLVLGIEPVVVLALHQLNEAVEVDGRRRPIVTPSPNPCLFGRAADVRPPPVLQPLVGVRGEEGALGLVGGFDGRHQRITSESAVLPVSPFATAFDGVIGQTVEVRVVREKGNTVALLASQGHEHFMERLVLLVDTFQFQHLLRHSRRHLLTRLRHGRRERLALGVVDADHREKVVRVIPVRAAERGHRTLAEAFRDCRHLLGSDPRIIDGLEKNAAAEKRPSAILYGFLHGRL